MPLVGASPLGGGRRSNDLPNQQSSTAMLSDVCFSLQQTVSSMQSRMDQLANAHATSERKRHAGEERIAQLEALRKQDLEQLLRNHKREAAEVLANKQLLSELREATDQLRANALDDGVRKAMYDLSLRRKEIESVLRERSRDAEKVRSTAQLLATMRDELDQLRADQIQCDPLGRRRSPPPPQWEGGEGGGRAIAEETTGGSRSLSSSSPSGRRTPTQRQLLAEVSHAWSSLETTARGLFNADESQLDLSPDQLGAVSPIAHLLRQPLPGAPQRPPTAAAATAVATRNEVQELRERLQQVSAKVEHEASSRMNLKVQCAEARAAVETINTKLLLFAPTDPSQQRSSNDAAEWAGFHRCAPLYEAITLLYRSHALLLYRSCTAPVALL